jgi:SAM-dependent methyltransferase
MRGLISRNRAAPAAVRAALASVPPAERDAWVDLVFGLDGIPEDGPDLPRGCVPYLPCPVETLLRMADHADLRSDDVFVDVGSGLGRATALTHLLTGAAAIGLEIQSGLVRLSRDLARSLNASRVSVVQGDAARLTGFMTIGTVFFLYCPFGGARLERVLSDLEAIAWTRPIRVCCVALPLPQRAWLKPVLPPSGDLAVYRSTQARAWWKRRTTTVFRGLAAPE